MLTLRRRWSKLALWAVLSSCGVLGTAYHQYAITSDLDESSKVGARIITWGGNAVDAAVAVALSVGALNAFASGLGGGGFALVRDAGGQMHGYNFRETAPSFAHRKHYTRQQDSLRGRRAIGIPGEVRGLWEMHQRHGRLPWADLFADTIAMLESGFKVGPVLAKKLKEFEDVVVKDPGLAATYTQQGKVVEENELITRKNLARTLEVISRDPESFYSGELAERFVAFINQTGNYVAPDDFRRYRAVATAPLVYSVGALTVSTLGLPTCGYMPVAALLVLAMFPDRWAALSEQQLQSVLAVLYRRLYEVRSTFEDEQNEDLNHQALVQAILNPDSFNELFQLVESAMAATDDPAWTLPTPATPAAKVLVDHGTTHINVVDPAGMMVSLTSTINNYWGAGLMDPETGVVFNDQMDDFLFEYRNMSGLFAPPQADPAAGLFKNAIAAHKRPLSSAIPVIVQHGHRFYVTGGSGGIRIPTAVISTLVRAIFQQAPLEQAIAQPRLHLQSPKELHVESSYPPQAIPEGYTVTTDDPDKIYSCVHLIAAEYPKSAARVGQFSSPLPPPRQLIAATDRRKHGASAGG